MAYAVQTLWPLIPQALSAGMGTPQVVRIQALERAARTLWRKKSLGAEEEFNEIFAALCRRYDSPDWVTDVLQGALETEIAEAADVDIALVRLELDAQLKGRTFPVVTPETVAHASSSLELNPVQARETINSKVRARPEVDKQSELGRLRQRAYQLTDKLAHADGLSYLIKPLTEQGLGFVVQDTPDERLTEALDEDLTRLITALWWQLTACSDEDWKTLVSLTETYRHLHRIPQETAQRRTYE